jgi:6-pyruvoyltetrahydropterin/6-carboxytetrahydropterin synthase
MYEISVRSRFSAAHHLEGYPGKCAAHHGHNWEVEVFLRGEKLNAAGMLVDFCDLKQAVTAVLDRLDHRDLNAIESMKGWNPTSENIARVIYQAVSAELNGGPYRVDRVCVRETPETMATYFERS